MAEKSVAKKSTAKSPKKGSGAKAGKTATSSKSPAKAAKAEKPMPSHEEISSKAHEIYLERQAKGEPGNPDSDWQQALKLLQKSK
jgi:hypothetical protein